MSGLYTPSAFAETDLAALDALFARDAFVTLVTYGDNGAPGVSHLPVLYRRDGERVQIEGHWARPNPQARQAGEALMIVHGPHAYISPGWYPDKEPKARVPTWNYVVAHLYGTLVADESPRVLADIVDRLSRHYEPTVGNDWRFEHDRDDHVSQLRGIVAFRFEATRVQIKSKLGQNHPEANVRAAAAGLQALQRREATEIAVLMLDRLENRPWI